MQHLVACVLFVAPLLALLLIVPFVFAHAIEEDISITATGECRDFAISVESDFPGCWDVKIDAPAVVRHGDEWRHSFFYAQSAMCDGSGSVDVRFTSGSNLTPTLKLRNGTTIVEKDFFVAQSCPDEMHFGTTALVSLIVIALLAAAALWYRK